MNKAHKAHRDKIAAMFVAALTEKKREWHKGWHVPTARPINATTGRRYRGINRFYLEMVAEEAGYSDNRWATFLQVKEAGWRVKKGAKAVDVEYWTPYDLQAKKSISWEVYGKRIQQDPTSEKDFTFMATHFKVFNGSQVEGIPSISPPEKAVEIVTSKSLEQLSSSMGVAIQNDGANTAFYNFKTDTIHLPELQRFFTEYDYHATAFHELAHATGHPNRLNRSLLGDRKSEAYAFEELVAELSSCFMGIHQDFAQSQEHVENHMAYLQSWISQISKKPEALFQAIAQAEKASDFMGYHLGLMTQQEYVKTHGNSLIVSASRTVDSGEVHLRQAPTTQSYAMFQNPLHAPQNAPPLLRTEGVALIKQQNVPLVREEGVAY